MKKKEMRLGGEVSQPSSKVPETNRINAKVHWIFYDSSTLARHPMLVLLEFITNWHQIKTFLPCLSSHHYTSFSARLLQLFSKPLIPKSINQSIHPNVEHDFSNTKVLYVLQMRLKNKYTMLQHSMWPSVTSQNEVLCVSGFGDRRANINQGVSRLSNPKWLDQ